MACSSCGNRMGSFHAYIPATDRSYIKTTGQTIGVPNDTGGIHARLQRGGTQGLGDIFGSGQTNWIPGIPNEYVVGAGVVILVLVMMR